MLKLRIITTTLVVAGALSTLYAASASANWFVNGTELKASVPLATTARVDQFTQLLFPSFSDLTIECTGTTLNGTEPEIVGPGATGKAASLEFKSCNTIKPATGCALNEANQTIATQGVTVRAFLKSGTEDGVLLAPQTKKTFAEIEFSDANTCAAAGLVPVKGSFTAGLPTGQAEESAQSFVGLGSVENNSLEISSGNKVYVVGGKALLTLASGSKWSFK